jgi:ribose transport system permease protein
VGEFSWIWIATVALFALSAIVAPGTVTSGSLLAMLPFAGILAIVATGQTVVIQQRGLDPSSAGIIGLAGIVFARVGAETGSLLIAVAAAMVSGALVGAINGVSSSRVSGSRRWSPRFP